MAYTIEQLRAARQAALNAGDQEAARELLHAATRLAAAQATPEHYDATEGMSTFDKVRAGIGQGLSNVARHAGNLVGLVDDDELEAARETDQDLLDTTAGKVGSFIGETAATALPMAGATAGLARAGGLGAKLVGGLVRRGAVEGAAQGALMADPGERGEGAFLGAGLGALLPAAARGIGKVARGLKRTPEAEDLLRRGVDLTPGQMNPGGMLNQMEEAWQSVPGVGSVIKGARDHAQNTFQRATAETAAAPGTKIQLGEMSEMLDAAYQSFQPLYAAAKGFPLRLVKGKPAIINATGTDTPLEDVFATIVKRKTAPASARRQVATFLDDQLTKKYRGSDDLLELRSMIRNEARKIRGNPNSNVDILARADLLDDADAAVTKALESQLPDDAMQALRTADSKYGLYKELETAVAGSRDMPGGLTPARLSQAVAGANKGAAQGSYARGGGGDLRDLAAAGTATMNVRSPATGARLAAIGIPAAASLTNPWLGIPAAAGGLALVGTKTGRKLAAGATSPQKRLAAALARLEGSTSPEMRELAGRYARALVGVAGADR